MARYISQREKTLVSEEDCMNAIQYDETLENSVSPLNPSTGEKQELILKEARDESAEWNMSPAELYGCLCHRPERTTGQ